MVGEGYGFSRGPAYKNLSNAELDLEIRRLNLWGLDKVSPHAFKDYKGSGNLGWTGKIRVTRIPTKAKSKQPRAQKRLAKLSREAGELFKHRLGSNE